VIGGWGSLVIMLASFLVVGNGLVVVVGVDFFGFSGCLVAASPHMFVTSTISAD